MPVNAGQKVIQRPDGTRFIKSVYLYNVLGVKGYVMVGGKRQQVEYRGKTVDSRGKPVYEFVK